MRLHVANHPLITHKLTVLRDRETSSATFRQLVDELVTLLAYEATREVAVTETPIETPVAPTVGLKLSEPRRHTIDLRVAQQDEDVVAGKVVVRAVKHILVVIPKSDKGGSVAPAAPSNGSGEYAVRYWATYIDGKKVREVDQLNFICYVNGTDYLADVRKALGM